VPTIFEFAKLFRKYLSFPRRQLQSQRAYRHLRDGMNYAALFCAIGPVHEEIAARDFQWIFATLIYN
jgi:hypothetical protein